MALSFLSSSVSLLFSHFPLLSISLCSVHFELKPQKQKQFKNTMLLGKRHRPPVNRTTSMSDIKFDLNLPNEPEPSDHHKQLSPQIQRLITVDEHRQVHHGLLDQRLTAMVSPRVTHRRYSAVYSTHKEDFLRSCSLCKRNLVPARDIYMYRGDGAFCSLECRQHQITVDERKNKVSLAVAAGNSKGKRASAAV